MANPFVHVELHTPNLVAARKFYAALFGWQLQDTPIPGDGGTYTMIGVGEGTGGGMMASSDPSVPPHWLAYVGVDEESPGAGGHRACRCDRSGVVRLDERDRRSHRRHDRHVEAEESAVARRRSTRPGSGAPRRRRA